MSPSSGVSVPRQELSIPRGSTAKIRLEVTKGGVPLDLALPGIVVVFTARLRGVLAFQHSYVSAGTVLPAEVAAGGIVQDTTDGAINRANVQVESADTADLATSDVLAYDAWLYTAAGDVVPIVVGTLRVEALPYTPA